MKLAYTCGFREKETLLEELTILDSLNSNSSLAHSVGRLPAVTTMDIGWDKPPIPSFEDNNDQPGSSSSSSSEEESKKKKKIQSSKKRRSEGGMDDTVNPQPSKRMRLQDDNKSKPATVAKAPSLLVATTAYQRITRDLGLMNGGMKNMKIVKMTGFWNSIEEEFRKEVYSHKDSELIEKFTIQWRRMSPALDEVEVIQDMYFSGNYVRLATAAVQLMVEEYRKSAQMMDAMEASVVRFAETPSLTALRLLLLNVRSVVVRMRSAKSKSYVVYDVVSSYSWPVYTTPAEIVRVVSESVPSPRI